MPKPKATPVAAKKLSRKQIDDIRRGVAEEWKAFGLAYRMAPRRKIHDLVLVSRPRPVNPARPTQGSNHYRRWTKEELEQFLALADSNMAWEEIAQRLGRSVAALRNACFRFELAVRERLPN